MQTKKIIKAEGLLKPTELMIGNVVMYGANILTIVSIDSERSIDTHGLNTAVRLSDGLAPWLNHVNPVPLNEEWLLKLGFEVYGLCAFHSKIGGCYLSMPYVGAKWYNIKSNGQDKLTSIKYVHQLQNFFQSITGESLKPNT